MKWLLTVMVLSPDIVFVTDLGAFDTLDECREMAEFTAESNVYPSGGYEFHDGDTIIRLLCIPARSR